MSNNPGHEGPVEVTRELLARYDKPGPRYTSYPTAPEWHDDFGDAEYRQALAKAATLEDEVLSAVRGSRCYELDSGPAYLK